MILKFRRKPKPERTEAEIMADTYQAAMLTVGESWKEATHVLATELSPAVEKMNAAITHFHKVYLDTPPRNWRKKRKAERMARRSL